MTQDTYRGETTDPGTWHLYTYCMNNPVDYIDPSGHWGEKIHKTKTIAWAKSLKMSGKDALHLGEADRCVDIDSRTDPYDFNNWKLSWHFDRSQGGQDTRLTRYLECYKEAIRIAKNKKKKKNAIWEFGRGLHAAQDRFAHLGWAKNSSIVTPHWAYKKTKVRVRGKYVWKWKRSIAVFDNPNYDLKKRDGKYYAYNKEKNGSSRYKKTRKDSLDKIKGFMNAIKYKK